MALQTNGTLTHLDVSHNEFGEIGGEAFGEAIAANRSLQTLELSGNRFGDDAAKAIGKGLEVNGALHRLNLSYNQIGDPGVVAIAAGLESNHCLLELVMDETHMCEKGAVALGNALKVNDALEVLNLHGNTIGDGGTQGIAQGLESNRSLRSLRMYRTGHTGDAGAVAIGEMLRRNKHVQVIAIDDVGDAGEEAISDAMESNTTCLQFDGMLDVYKHFQRNRSAASAFVEACKVGDFQQMAKLRAWGVSVDAKPYGLSTALEMAVRAHKEDTVETLRLWGAKKTKGAVEAARGNNWSRAWHWIGSSLELDVAMETALVINAEEREVMFEAGGMEEYQPTAQWWTLPDEVMERVMQWMWQIGCA